MAYNSKANSPKARRRRPLVTNYRQDDDLFPGYWHRVGLVVLCIALIVYPLIGNDFWLSIANKTLIYIVGSVALMILTGFTGQISLGHAAFFAAGAYTAAIIGHRIGLPFWMVIPVSGLVAAAIGFMIGHFALRLKGLYLAIITLGLVYIVRHLLHSFPDYTGGVAGIAVPMNGVFSFGTAEASSFGSFAESLEFGALEIERELKMYLLYIVIVIAVLLFARNLQRSQLGRAMMAVRDNDLAAQAMGIQLSRVKVLSFGISSFLAGVAGAMFGFHQQLVTIDPFGLEFSIEFVAIIILGGAGTVSGAVLGAVAYVFLSPLAETLGRMIPYVKDDLSSHQQSVVLFSIVVGVFLIFEPLGLFGIWLRIKRYFQAWPFRY